MPPWCFEGHAKSSAATLCVFIFSNASRNIKARLIKAGAAFPKTHDLEKLLDLAIAVEPLWATLRPALSALSDQADQAVGTRYPGRTTTPSGARSLLAATARIRKLIRLKQLLDISRSKPMPSATYSLVPADFAHKFTHHRLRRIAGLNRPCFLIHA